eukprot:TRINITY_DN63190_c0_g1_i1.p1 TRINITY_DN63190_c0_g1~~TRINITY_DN63190_c0_g1_i1.p1  ORF type:complete len:982 (-),score=255.91 TRINITY_DN63190_c0_g1_i1:110-3055(-)
MAPKKRSASAAAGADAADGHGLLKMLCSPTKSGSAAPAETTPSKVQSTAKRARRASSSSMKPSESAKPVNKESAVVETTDAEAAAVPAPAQPDATKKAQKRVNDNKTKEEELKRAQKLLEDCAARLAGETGDRNTGSDEEAEAPDTEAWDTSRRREAARSAWALRGVATQSAEENDLGTAHFRPSVPSAAAGKRAHFGLVARALETQKDQGVRDECLELRTVANMVRQILASSDDKEADLNALLTVLLASSAATPGQRRRKLLPKPVFDAVSVAFACKDISRSLTPEELAATALAARRKQRTLFLGKRVTLVDAAGAIEAAAAAAAASEEAAEPGRLVERLTKLLAASDATDRETFHLVHLLAGCAVYSRDVVLRGFAHGLVLHGEPVADAPALVEAMLAMEDDVLSAFASDGGQSTRLARAAASAVEGRGGTNLTAACPPLLRTQVLPARPALAKSPEAALEGLGSGAVIAEWLMPGEKVQIHVDRGAVVDVFAKGRLNPELLADIAGSVEGQLVNVQSGIFEAVYLKGRKTPAVTSSNAEASAPSAAPAPPAAAAPAAAAVPGTLQMYDLLLLNGESLVGKTLRERRALLQKALSPTALLVRMAKGTEISAEDLSTEVIMKHLDEALSAVYLASKEEKPFSKANGLVLKRLDGAEATYVAGHRCQGWQALEKPPLVGAVAERKLFETLTEEERAHWPSKDEFLFTVVSGFRTRSVEGITDILRIQKLYNEAGVSPTWYVDNECPDEYRKLGLTVVKAGKLIPARNKALEDAVAVGKVCVQTSDDIGSWQVFNDMTRYRTDEDANAAWRRCEKLNVSPVAAAQFLLAKMRARGSHCKLGGVFPLSNGGRAFRAEPVSYTNFILGDFFVAENTELRFDERLSLKEDYDFTASHLEKYGEVLRSNRLLITAKHETNAGGACAVRDAEGEKERYNIGVLREKWPGAILNHPTRANQIVLRWKSLKRGGNTSAAEVEADEGDEP